MFSKLITTLFPETAGSSLETTLKSVFEDDFTAYLYYDNEGVWPGYVVKIKPNADVDRVSLLAALAELEGASINNFYITPPAGQPQEFRSGSVKDVYTSRYAPYSVKPASFNYGLFNDYLVIATSYQNLLKALENLGL